MTEQTLLMIVSASETLRLRLRLMVEDLGGRVLAASTPEQAMVLPGGKEARALVVDSAFRDNLAAFAGDRPVVVAGRDWEQLRERVGELLDHDDKPEARHLAEAMAQARILIVDDSVTYREFLRLELSAGGAHVVACGDAEKALMLLLAESFDAVLVDLVMPGMGGAELCGRIAALRRDRAAPFAILALSSREGPGEYLRAIEAGADAFLGKAQDMSVLKARIGAHLRRCRLDLAR